MSTLLVIDSFLWMLYRRCWYVWFPFSIFFSLSNDIPLFVRLALTFLLPEVKGRDADLILAEEIREKREMERARRG